MHDNNKFVTWGDLLSLLSLIATVVSIVVSVWK